MVAFTYQYSDLVMLIFKQVAIIGLIIIAFNFGTDERDSIDPMGYVQENLSKLIGASLANENAKAKAATATAPPK